MSKRLAEASSENTQSCYQDSSQILHIKREQELHAPDKPYSPVDWTVALVLEQVDRAILWNRIHANPLPYNYIPPQAQSAIRVPANEGTAARLLDIIPNHRKAQEQARYSKIDRQKRARGNYGVSSLLPAQEYHVPWGSDCHDLDRCSLQASLWEVIQDWGTCILRPTKHSAVRHRINDNNLVAFEQRNLQSLTTPVQRDSDPSPNYTQPGHNEHQGAK